MILIPLPAIVALLLGFVLCLVALKRERRFRPIIVFLAVSTALMTVVSLRWSFDAPVFRFLQPVFAALLPATAWLCFAGLEGGARRPAWPHYLPGAVILVLSLLWPYFQTPIDALLAFLFFGYGSALMWRGLQGEENFAGARLGAAVDPCRAAMFVGALLVFSGMIDLAIAFDFGLAGGAHAATIVSVGNMAVLPLIAWAALAVARSLPETEEPPAAEATTRVEERDQPTADDALVLAATHRVLSERQLYRDPDLTLERLARRVGIPGRQISQAINRRLGRNVSQEINQWRIREAMALLEETDRPVTAIMFDCGFQTKSNFNNTFRRVTGLSPSDWRRRAKETGETRLSAAKASGPETP
ncbi:helix-turn-helix domain-containing protein [Nitratireductor aquimarinus]|uniref:helix-turn-helix domain-containing protein n=1 Tax=Nitratireductor TaxID=245876 RepID=UPI0019D3D97C|nr:MULTISPECIES: AraC family transcriptional regulator [Nitratireductor]MBN7776632.1 helix-turn-helix domain-containing protein [Nitratireductor pacificus]MBN7779966.1 helix-turn-helix domain-containing protein [Nitratireductor pacificus]MBN7788773.1 helix-turn-helix domain-containing protein [Nitratireductor aquimarinus]MBY6098841.1 AraC family transcriptional regulator [Nitratireductor aquimarinus]MCA1262927.1 AraC family transcriptional regulator [Nitratireductor aquimarinus]